MNLFDKIVSDIVALDKVNMTSILSEHGMSFDKKEVIRSIRESNPGLENTFCYYDEQGELLGYFRFNFTAEGGILVSSIQLADCPSKAFVLRKLLLWGYFRLKQPDIPSYTEISTWTNTKNGPSIILQEKMGLQWSEGHRDASKFITTKAKLIERLEAIGLTRIFERHPGKFPVRVLAHNLPFTFVMHKPENAVKLHRAIQDGRLSPAISYISQEDFGMIYATPDTMQICVHEQFLAFLWSFIYAAWIITEVGVQKKVILNGDSSFDGKIDDSTEIVKRSFLLLKWAISLPKQFSPWPSQLPSPQYFQTAEEQFYIEKVNGIYLKAASYLLNHEAAHLINNHWETLEPLRSKKINERTEEEIALYKMIEQEADRFAQEEMIDGSDSEWERFTTGISIVLVYCASLFTLQHPSLLETELHPDIDNRLFNAIAFLQLKDPKNVDYIFIMASLMVNYYISINSAELRKVRFKPELPASVESPQDYFLECLKLIDQIKLRYSEYKN